MKKIDKLIVEETNLYKELPWVNGKLDQKIDTDRIAEIRNRLEKIDKEISKLKVRK